MPRTAADFASRLACCHGYLVESGDTLVGVVETPVFSGAGLAPDALIVRTIGAAAGGYHRVASDLVVDLDENARRITLKDDADPT